MNDRRQDRNTGSKRIRNLGKVSLIGVDSIEQVDMLIIIVMHLRASDIHLDISEDATQITLRVGLSLRYKTIISTEIARSIIGRIKVLAQLRLDINDRSQDGSFIFHIPYSQSRAYIRISTAPTVFGENAVCRIFSNTTESFDLQKLGLTDSEYLALVGALQKDSGLILVSGPTGSGKTTTLYSCIRELSSRMKVVVTLEDPVEVVIPNIRQIVVRNDAGFGFYHALKSVLRQDPDVIMVGEIRDKETAELAIQAALTGHLVLATIHASSALGIIDRLNSIGVKSEACAQVINLLISQRKISLKNESLSEDQEFKIIFEIVEFNQKFKSQLLLSGGAGSHSLAQTIREQGILLLKDRVEHLFYEGHISREEMVRYIR